MGQEKGQKGVMGSKCIEWPGPWWLGAPLVAGQPLCADRAGAGAALVASASLSLAASAADDQPSFSRD